MKLIVLLGHDRKLTKVKFGRDDDLVFTSAANSIVCVWDSTTGERLGTYNGHKGAVSDFDVDHQSNFLLTGSGDSSVRIWQVNTGKTLQKFATPARINSVQWACGDKQFLATSPQFLQNPSCVHIYNNPVSNQYDSTEENDHKESGNKPLTTIQINNDENKINFGIKKGAWSPLNDQIFALCSDNSIRIIDVEKGIQTKKVIFVKNIEQEMKLDNYNEIGTEMTDFRYCADYCTAVVCSRSKYAKMYDVYRWDEPICSYKCDRALNTIAVHPKMDMIAMGGGKPAQDAAQNSSNGKYEAVFYHKIFEQQIGKIETGCFSPLNSMDWNSDGSQLVLGYEEGQARLFTMDADFEKQFDKRIKTFTSIEKEESDDDEFDV